MLLCVYLNIIRAKIKIIWDFILNFHLASVFVRCVCFLFRSSATLSTSKVSVFSSLSFALGDDDRNDDDNVDYTFQRIFTFKQCVVRMKSLFGYS